MCFHKDNIDIACIVAVYIPKNRKFDNTVQENGLRRRCKEDQRDQFYGKGCAVHSHNGSVHQNNEVTK